MRREGVKTSFWILYIYVLNIKTNILSDWLASTDANEPKCMYFIPCYCLRSSVEQVMVPSSDQLPLAIILNWTMGGQKNKTYKLIRF